MPRPGYVYSRVQIRLFQRWKCLFASFSSLFSRWASGSAARLQGISASGTCPCCVYGGVLHLAADPFFFAAYKLQQQIRSVVSGCRTSERFMLPIRLSHSEIYIDPMIPYKLYLYCNTNTALLVTITCHRFAVLFFLGLFFSSGASTDELTTPTRLNLYEPCVVTPFFLAHCFMTAPPYRPNIDTQQKSPVPCTCPPFQQLHKLQTPSLPTPFLRQPPQQPP